MKPFLFAVLLFSLSASAAAVAGVPAKVTVDLAEEIGPIKRMNGVGNGPDLGRPDGDSAENSGNGELSARPRRRSISSPGTSTAPRWRR